MRHTNDTLLISRVMLFDDRRAFATLVEQHQPTIRRFFLHQTMGDEMLSDDLAQETFIKLYYSIKQFIPRCKKAVSRSPPLDVFLTFFNTEQFAEEVNYRSPDSLEDVKLLGLFLIGSFATVGSLTVIRILTVIRGDQSTRATIVANCIAVCIDPTITYVRFAVVSIGINLTAIYAETVIEAVSPCIDLFGIAVTA